MNDNFRPGRIAGVKHSAIDSKSRSAALNAVSLQLKQEEFRYIKAWRKLHKRPMDSDNDDLSDLNGLAFSGGGIRSASFALGILQALQHYDLLKKFDYLSSVSGGGYSAAAVNWLTSQQANNGRTDSEAVFSLDNFPFGQDNPDAHEDKKDSPEQQAVLNYLRQHGHYLSPGGGINIFALLGTIARGTVLNLIVWLPLLMLILIAGFWVPQEIEYFNLFAGSPWLSSILNSFTVCYEQCQASLLGYEFLLKLAALIVFLSVLTVMGYSLMTWVRRSSDKSMISGLRWYKWRRFSEKLASVLIPFTLLIVIIGLLPVVTFYFSSMGTLMLVAGISMHLHKFIRSLNSQSENSLGLVVIIGSALFLYGFFAVAFQLSYSVWLIKPGDWFFWILLVLFLIPVIIGFFSNLNYISIHRFYRDRLMETFMPDIDTALKNKTGMAAGADEAYLCDFNAVDAPNIPYHLINANVVLVDSKDTTYQLRGGDNFILSPYYCGSSATGWCPTQDFMGGKMTLATAISISGAAVNPNAAVGGKGVTRNRVLSLVLSLLNLRLGYWAHHPLKPPFNAIANHINPGICYTLGSFFKCAGFKEDEPFIELTDGGHFENLGLYELIRRQCGLILVSDAGEDASFSFSGFQTTVRRIEDDFDVHIDFHEPQYSPDTLMPKKPAKPLYPEQAKFSDKGFMLATIHYPNGRQGKLFYIKTTLIPEASFKVKGYKAQAPDFPDQSTADQFFDEAQFEAYRELGYKITDSLVTDAELKFQQILK